MEKKKLIGLIALGSVWALSKIVSIKIKPIEPVDANDCREKLHRHYVLESTKVFNKHARETRLGGGRMYSTTLPPIPDVDKMTDDMVIGHCKHLELI